MIFIVLTSGLLIGAVLKERMGDRLEQAGLYTMVEVSLFESCCHRLSHCGKARQLTSRLVCPPAAPQRFRRPTRTGFRSMGR